MDEIVRVLKSRTISSDFDKFYEREFCDILGEPDLNLSVYVIGGKEPNHPERIFSEHVADAGMSPVRKTCGVLLPGETRTDAQPTGGSQYKKSKHHEVRDLNKEQLRKTAKTVHGRAMANSIGGKPTIDLEVAKKRKFGTTL